MLPRAGMQLWPWLSGMHPTSSSWTFACQGATGSKPRGASGRLTPRQRVVVLTTYADDASIGGALRAGAIGYLTKDAGRDDIRRALEAAAAGQAVMDPEVQARLLQTSTLAATGSGTPPDGLTEREAEVLRLMAAGLSNTEICTQLYVSEATVKTHINHIFTKTNSRDRSQAVAYAHRRGLAS